MLFEYKKHKAGLINNNVHLLMQKTKKQKRIKTKLKATECLCAFLAGFCW